MNMGPKIPPRPQMGPKKLVKPKVTGMSPKKPAGAQGFGVPLQHPAAAAIKPGNLGAGPASLPVDPQYDAQVASATQRRDSTIAGLTGDRQRALTDFGFNEQGGALTFNANNPFSRAAVLKRSYDQQRTGNVNSMAARGQLYSGALQNAQDTSNRNQIGSEDALLKALAGYLSQNSSAATAAQQDYNDVLSGAGADRVARAGDNPLYSPIPDVPVAASPTSSAAPASPAAKAAKTAASKKAPAKKKAKPKVTYTMTKKRRR